MEGKRRWLSKRSIERNVGSSAGATSESCTHLRRTDWIDVGRGDQKRGDQVAIGDREAVRPARENGAVVEAHSLTTVSCKCNASRDLQQTVLWFSTSSAHLPWRTWLTVASTPGSARTTSEPSAVAITVPASSSLSGAAWDGLPGLRRDSLTVEPSRSPSLPDEQAGVRRS